MNDADEGAKAIYLHNAWGQRVFKSEPQVDYTAPNETTLGADFIAWLKTNFKWLFAQAQANASLGSSYMYGDGPIPSWAILGEYSNGAATGTGRTEYIWLPPEDGQAIPIAMFRAGRFWNIHSDHLGTPRAMTDDTGKPVWQWPYSAFGETKPTGILTATANPNQAITAAPLLKATAPAAILNLRFPGQYFDSETNLFYNGQRTYDPIRGSRYTQADPIGLDGGWNRFGYVGGNPLGATDPLGLQVVLPAPALPSLTSACLANPALCGPALAGAGGYAAGTLLYPLIEKPLASVIDSCMNSDGLSREECKQSCVKDYEVAATECQVAHSFWGKKGYQACMSRAGDRLGSCMKRCDGK